MRRTKKQIFKIKSVEQSGEPLKDNELPLKTDLVVWINLTDTQKKLYEHIINHDSVKNVIASGLFINAFCLLSCIKKLCQHPLLLIRGAMNTNEDFDKFFTEDQLDVNPDEDEDEINNDSKVAEQNDEDRQTKMLKQLDLKTKLMPTVNNYNKGMIEGILNESSKLVFLYSLLENLKSEGHKVLIYSMSKVMINIIERIAKAAGDFEYRRIDGDTEIEERDKIQKEFNKNPKIFMCLLTTKVGGWGLNLVAADRVIIYDPDWNPANDNQAVDRLYRIGQKKDVIVYRLITINSIEERIYRRQIHKQGINKATVENNDNRGVQKYFSAEDLFELFNFDSVSNECKTLDILKESEKLSKENNDWFRSDNLKNHLKFIESLPHVNFFGPFKSIIN